MPDGIIPNHSCDSAQIPRTTAVAIETDKVSIIGGTAGTGGSITVKSAAFNGSGDYANYVDGYIRVLLWK